MNNSEDSTLEKRAKILNYFFEHGTDEVKPRDFKESSHLNNNATRTLIRNFQWFHGKYVIFSKAVREFQDGNYDSDYMLTENEKVKFVIPLDKEERLDYATFITSHLMTSNKGIDNDTFIQDKVLPLFSMLMHFGNGIARESILAAEIYTNVKSSKGNLLSILFKLSKFNQAIDIHIKSDNETIYVKDTRIDTVAIESDKKIVLVLKDRTITLSSLEDIVDIFIISDNFPPTAMGIPNLNIVQLVEAFKAPKQYAKMNECYENIVRDFEIESDDELDTDLNKMIDKLVRNKVNGIPFYERARRRIRVSVV